MNPLIACRLIMIFATYFPDIGKCPALCKVSVMIFIVTHITYSDTCQLECHVQLAALFALCSQANQLLKDLQ